jgi:hypothetical protein
MQSIDSKGESGGIGRRTRLRIWRVTPVRVRVPPFAPITYGHSQRVPVSIVPIVPTSRFGRGGNTQFFQSRIQLQF